MPHHPPISPQVPARPTPHLGPLTPQRVARWTPTLAIWGIAAAAAVTVFMSGVPRFQQDVLGKVPVVAAAFKDDTPDSDKPF